MSEVEVERCARCRRLRVLVLGRQHPNGKVDGLCQECADEWLESDEEFGPPEKEPYYGPFPQNYFG